MTIPRFYCQFKKEGKNIFISQPDIIHQIKNVLRLKPGAKVVFFDGSGLEAEAAIINVGAQMISLEVERELVKKNYSEKNIRLYCSILKKENFELAVAKAVELGVSSIKPLITQRTVKIGLNQTRLQKIIKESAEQSGRIELPKLYAPITFKEAIAETSHEDGLNVFFNPDGEDCHNLFKLHPDKINVFVGPEGGWTPNEVDAVLAMQAKSRDWRVVSFGHLIYRAETAAITATFLAKLLCIK